MKYGDNNALQYASDKIKNNEKIVLKSIKLNYTTLCFASDKLKNNKKFILKAVMINGFGFRICI